MMTQVRDILYLLVVLFPVAVVLWLSWRKYDGYVEGGMTPVEALGALGVRNIVVAGLGLLTWWVLWYHLMPRTEVVMLDNAAKSRAGRFLAYYWQNPEELPVVGGVVHEPTFGADLSRGGVTPTPMGGVGTGGEGGEVVVMATPMPTPTPEPVVLVPLYEDQAGLKACWQKWADNLKVPLSVMIQTGKVNPQDVLPRESGSITLTWHTGVGPLSGNWGELVHPWLGRLRVEKKVGESLIKWSELISKKFGSYVFRLQPRGVIPPTCFKEVSTSTPQPMPTSTPTPTRTATYRPGQPTATPQPAATSAETCTYTVQAGDTLLRIARRYGTTAAVLASLNGVANLNFIQIGQELKVPCPQ